MSDIEQLHRLGNLLIAMESAFYDLLHARTSKERFVRLDRFLIYQRASFSASKLWKNQVKLIGHNTGK